MKKLRNISDSLCLHFLNCFPLQNLAIHTLTHTHESGQFLYQLLDLFIKEKLLDVD